jgi:protocatechuate 3,4-dioxygenase beta subunit
VRVRAVAACNHAASTAAKTETRNRRDRGEPAAIVERIIVERRVVDEDGRPVPSAMVEIWRANAAGRYHHEHDRHDAPRHRHFSGVGRVFSDADGHDRFTSIKPGAYPWRNHADAWRPNHIHSSRFGPASRHGW